MARLPLPANPIAALADMTCRTWGNITCRVVILVTREEKLMCFVNILYSASWEVFVLVGANLLLYKSLRGNL
jgi:hypothetical protein